MLDNAEVESSATDTNNESYLQDAVDNYDAKQTDSDSSSESTTDAKAGDSSPSESEDAKGPKSMIEAVAAVMEDDKAKTDTKAEESSTSKVESGEDKSTAKDKAEDTTRFDQHPRFRELRQDRDKFKTEAETYKVKSDRFDVIQRFAEDNGLSGEEIAQGFNVMSALKNDPQKAMELLNPILNQLQNLLGEALDEDLQAKVKQGYIDEATAKEYQRERSMNRFNTEKSQREEARTRHNAKIQEAERQNVIRAEAATALNSLESQWEQTDPDYAKKKSAVHREIKVRLISQTGPMSVIQLQNMAKEAKESVDKELRQFLPRREPKSPVTQTGSGGKTASAPASMLEAITNAVGGA